MNKTNETLLSEVEGIITDAAIKYAQGYETDVRKTAEEIIAKVRLLPAASPKDSEGEALAEEIARGALGLDWRDTESQARMVAMHAAELLDASQAGAVRDIRNALMVARKGYASMRATGEPCLAGFTEHAIGLIDEALATAPPAPVEAEAVVLPAWWDAFIQNVCEIPDRNSPEDEPEAMVATREELESCALRAIEDAAPSDAPAQQDYNMRVLRIAGTICNHLDTALDQSRVMAAARDIAAFTAPAAQQEPLNEQGDELPPMPELTRLLSNYGFTHEQMRGYARAALSKPATVAQGGRQIRHGQPHIGAESRTCTNDLAGTVAQGDEATIQDSRTVQLSGNSGELDAQGDERAAFEAWGLSQHYEVGHKSQDGTYIGQATAIAWEAWQARAALSRQPIAGDAERLDWLEAQINAHGAIHLHDGNQPYGHGLGLRPGSLKRTLRAAVDAARAQRATAQGDGNG